MIMTKLAIVYIQTVYRKNCCSLVQRFLSLAIHQNHLENLKTTNNLNLRMDFSGFTTNLLNHNLWDQDLRIWFKGSQVQPLKN